ncbi:MAG: ytrB 1 [Myxococcales bacterium]|nr:ytrB 1 [Myxococcales bacterium]
MTEVVAQLAGVSKAYGKIQALRGLTLAIPRGSVVGLLGRNAAGKSTALRCLVGLERADAGTVRVLGQDPRKLDVAARRRFTFLSEQGVPFPAASAADLVKLCSPLYPDWNRQLELQVLSRFNIDPRRRLRDLSLGQQRAVGLVLAICPQPELLILDEPAANLDAVSRREFLEVILGLVGQGDRSVIFSSHVLSDVERVADRVAILDGGRLLADRALDDLKEQVRRLRFVFDRPPPDDLAIPGALAMRRAGREILVTVGNYEEGLAGSLAASLGATAVDDQRLGLEELFIDLVGDDRVPERDAA